MNWRYAFNTFIPVFIGVGGVTVFITVGVIWWYISAGQLWGLPAWLLTMVAIAFFITAWIGDRK